MKIVYFETSDFLLFLFFYEITMVSSVCRFCTVYVYSDLGYLLQYYLIFWKPSPP